MYFEILGLAALLLFILNYTGILSFNKLVSDNEMYFKRLKEEDWDFLVKARYGDSVNADFLFNKRIRNAGFTILALLFLFILDLSYIKVILAIVAGIFMFKTDYSNLKTYYKKHLHQIDAMLPHYLKNLEILIQHYTVPVAIGKSIEDAPSIFKDGLNELINEINSGDDTINPYVNFAKKYPVRDSMRMMRLLYRLSLGRQEAKQEQLLTFSKTISNLQQKAREIKYRERLDKMEGKTMQMLIVTGLGIMILLIVAVMMMMNM